MKRNLKIAVFGSLLLALFSCGHGGKEGDSLSDTLFLPPAPSLPIVREAPDTVFPSVSKLQFSITVFDTVTPGKLERTNDAYANTPGVFTFRGNALRDKGCEQGCVGRISGTPTELVVDWTFRTEEDYSPTDFGAWEGGTGWTGQPLYVQWPDTILSRLKDKKLVNDGFSGKEIMLGSLCMKAYFIDYETGKPSRQPISVGNPIKGTMSLDPSLNGNLYFGQGVPANQPFGAGVIDLFSNKISDFFGRDNSAWRGWGAYDSSPLRVGQFLFRPGENGTLYKFTVQPGKLTLHSTLRYRVGGVAPGMEASMAQWLNYGYTADNHGNILCVNLNTMQPVWHYSLEDDIDSTPVIAIEDGTPYIYVGCEVDKAPQGPAKYVKLNGKTGQPVWLRKFDAVRRNTEEKHFDGGFYATSLLGKGDCKDLVYISCVNNAGGANGTFLALSRATGETVFKISMSTYGWSSPVGFINEKSKFYVVYADCGGRMTLIDGKTGTKIDSKSIGSNFESSPVVVGNTLVVGSRGNSIFKISVK